jgi:hypothetical protein
MRILPQVCKLVSHSPAARCGGVDAVVARALSTGTRSPAAISCAESGHLVTRHRDYSAGQWHRIRRRNDGVRHGCGRAMNHSMGTSHSSRALSTTRTRTFSASQQSALGAKRSATRLRGQPVKPPLAAIELREGESLDELLERCAQGRQTSVPLNSLLVSDIHTRASIDTHDGQLIN